eukprot:6202813-Pleurochrysis_carterae.AAC.1
MPRISACQTRGTAARPLVLSLKSLKQISMLVLDANIPKYIRSGFLIEAAVLLSGCKLNPFSILARYSDRSEGR